MAETKKEKTDEEEVFEEFNITDDKDKESVRLSAATRVLAARKIAKIKGDRRLW